MISRERLLELIRTKAVLRGNFTLSSGVTSNYYIDIKRISFDGEALEALADMMVDMLVRNFETRDVAGVELGGVPLVAAVVLRMMQRGFRSRGVIIRKSPKEHGTKRWFEGPDDLKRVVLLEDVITTGRTTISAVEKLKDGGIDVEGVICVVDRGGTESVSRVVRTIRLFSVDEVLGETSW